jgi:uncharacterized protein (DUF1810 family)
MTDPFNLKRFVDAQDPVLQSVRSELQRGSKQGHWIWFFFPQLKGLGSSSTATYYGIASRAEAEAFVKHAVLGPRLLECTQLVTSVEGRSIEAILGGIDAMKFRSSMTLFRTVSPDQEVFARALQKYFDGEPDPLTVKLLRATQGG